MASNRRDDDRVRRSRPVGGVLGEALPPGAAYLDDLTGLRNRRFVTHLFTAGWDALTTRHREVSFVLIDLDGFKAINDTYGHGAGDEVLKVVSSLLAQQFRADDVVVRYGGDEFLVILPGAGEAGASEYAHRARAAVSGHRYVTSDGTPIELPLSFSVGVASYPGAGAAGAEVLAMADRRLYEEKRRRSMRRTTLDPVSWGLAALLVVMVASIYLTLTWRPGSQPRPAVAVLGFKNLTGQPDAAWLSTALEEMVSAELAVSGEVRMIPGEEVARARFDLKLPATDSLAPDTLARVRSHLGADIVVMGSYLSGPSGGGQIRLDVRAQNAVQGGTVGAVIETGSIAELSPLVQRTGALLREKLGLLSLSNGAARQALAAMPATLAATRFYAEGVAALQGFDALTARERLERAVAAEPASPLAHAALAEAWSALGYDARAMAEARRAFELGSGLSREDRLRVEARFREAQGDWEPAADSYARLFAFAPDNIDYGLSLARSHRMAGKAVEASAVLNALRALPAPSRDDARIDLEAAETLTDLGETIAASRRAITKARAQGATLLVARASLIEAFALAQRGQFQEASDAAAEARTIFAAAGHRGGVARALNRMAQAKPDDILRARDLIEQALAISRDIGDRRFTGQLLNNLALTYSDQGDLSRARPLFDEALAIFEEVGARRLSGLVLLNVGRDLNSAGRPAEAREFLGRSLQIHRELKDRLRVVYVLNNLGNSAQLQGDVAEAWRLYSESLPICRDIGDRRQTAYTVFDLGEVLFLRGDLQSARSRHEEALALREQLKLKTDAAESRLALARVALAEQRPEAAESEARRALDVFVEMRVLQHEAAARAELAKALLAQHRTREAEDVLRPTLGLSRTLQYASIRIDLEVVLARMRAEQGGVAEAVESLRKLAEEAKGLGIVREALNARLVEASLRTDPSALALRTAVEEDARHTGFGLDSVGSGRVGGGFARR